MERPSIETAGVPMNVFRNDDAPELLNTQAYSATILSNSKDHRSEITSRWNVDPGQFDWSSCNTPVILPSSLTDIDMDSFVLTSQAPHDNTHTTSLGGTLPGVLHPFMHFSGGNPDQAGFQRHRNDIEPAATLFDRFYGTTAILNPMH